MIPRPTHKALAAILSIVSLVIILGFASCDSESVGPPATFETISVASAAEGSNIEIYCANLAGKTVISVSIGGQKLGAAFLTVTDTYIKVRVPFFETPGLVDVVVNIEGQPEIVIPGAFEYLPIAIGSVSKSKLSLFSADTLSITLDNLPELISAQSFLFKDKNGLKSNDAARGFLIPFNVLSFEENILTIRTHAPDPDELVGNTYYLEYKTYEIPIPVEFREMVRLAEPNSKYTPDQQIYIYSRQGHEQIQTYVNGQEISLNWYNPLSTYTFDGLRYLHSFRTPALPPGKYKLEVLIVPTGEMALLHGGDSIVIEDMKYCPEGNVYSSGESMKIFVEGGESLGLWDNGGTAEGPTKVSLWDISHEVEFEAEITEKHLVEYITPGQSYLVVKVPSDIVPNALYKVEISTSNGYRYKIKQGCGTEIIQIE